MDADFLKGLPCDKSDCRLARHPNVAISHEHTPAVTDREGKEIEPAVTKSEIAYEVSCSACGKTYRQPEVNGVKGEWAEYVAPKAEEAQAT